MSTYNRVQSKRESAKAAQIMEKGADVVRIFKLKSFLSHASKIRCTIVQRRRNGFRPETEFYSELWCISGQFRPEGDNKYECDEDGLVQRPIYIGAVHSPDEVDARTLIQGKLFWDTIIGPVSAVFKQPNWLDYFDRYWTIKVVNSKLLAVEPPTLPVGSLSGNDEKKNTSEPTSPQYSSSSPVYGPYSPQTSPLKRKEKDATDHIPPMSLTDDKKQGASQMQIFVKTLTGRTLTLDVEPMYRIEQVKTLINERIGTQVGLQRLIFAGQPLADSNTLREYSIMKDSTLHLINVLRGS